MTTRTIEALQGAIDYHFRDPELLSQALTHSSYSREARGGEARDNEQLEFLGDAVLGFVVSARLFGAFPECPEGQLSRARASLVAMEHLAKAAARIELSDYLRLGRGEEKTGGRSKSRLAVNALEALVAAIYRDGGVDAAERFILRFILPADLEAIRDELFTVDYKSSLQEYLQAEHLGLAAYRIVGEDGPEHRKTFAVEVSASGFVAVGKGSTKKFAEQEAAHRCLTMVERSRKAGG